MMSAGSFIDVETEYAKDKKLKKEDIRQLQEWAKKQPHLPEISGAHLIAKSKGQERQLIFFLHSCYFSNEAAKACIETYYTVRAHCPEFFNNRDLRMKRNYDEVFSTLTYMSLPKITPDGYKILFGQLVDPDPDKFNINVAVKSLDMTNTLMLHQEGTFKGEIVLVDFKWFTMSHLSKMSSLIQLKKFFTYFQEGMPIRVVSLHIMNVPPFFDKILTLAKPFMRKELLNSLFIYTKDLNELYKAVPLECLPKDYGGELESSEVLRDRWWKNLQAHSDFFVEEEKAVADESKRLGNPKNDSDVFGIDGSFKKLDID